MEAVINKGLGLALAVVFLAVALLVFGSLGSGTGSFWHGINNINTSLENTTAGSGGKALGTGTIGTAVNTIEQTAVPILIAIGVVAGLVVAVLKAMGVF